MLYEPPKTKKYIVVGAIAVALAVLVIAAIPPFYKSKTIQTPVTNLSSLQEKIQQEKVQQELKKLDEVKKSQNDILEPTQADIRTELKRIDKENKKSGIPLPAQEDIQKQLNLLSKMKK